MGPIRASRRTSTNGTSRSQTRSAIFVGNRPGHRFLELLLSNLTDMHGRGRSGMFQVMMGEPPGSNDFLMYGNPGDYAWGRGSFDAIVTQLLNQMEETAGPPKMDKKEIVEIPTIKVSQQHIDQKTQCSVCWEYFVLGESVRQLRCEHIFHQGCIVPGLELHATCPVCRKALNDAAAAHSQAMENEMEESGHDLIFAQ